MTRELQSSGIHHSGSLFDGIVLVANTPANIAAVSSKIIAPNFLFAA